MTKRFSRVMELFSKLVKTEDGDLLLLVGDRLVTVDDDVNLQYFFDYEPELYTGSIHFPLFKVDIFMIISMTGQEYAFSLQGKDFVEAKGSNTLESSITVTTIPAKISAANSLFALTSSERYNLDSPYVNTEVGITSHYCDQIIKGDTNLVSPVLHKKEDDSSPAIRIDFTLCHSRLKFPPIEVLKYHFSDEKFIDDLLSLNEIIFQQTIEHEISKFKITPVVPVAKTTGQSAPIIKVDWVEEDKGVHKDRLFRAVNYGEKYGTCDRLKVGAVLYQGDELIGIGFNTSPGNVDTCNELGHKMVKGSCKRTVHAEINALMDAVDNKKTVTGSVMYCSHKPCIDCIKILDRAGVKIVYFEGDYDSDYDDLKLKIQPCRIIK